MNDAPRRVLMLAYFFPPFRTVGGLRVSKHTKFLPAFGWEPVVLTADWNDGPADLPVYVPESSVLRVPQGFDIAAVPRMLLGGRRPSAGEPQARSRRRRLAWAEAAYRQLVCVPDAQIGWRAPAVAAGLRAIEERKPSVIFSSSLPNTAHIVAAKLSKLSGLPWVAEMRDLWTANHNFRRVQPIRALEQAWERRVLSKATALVTVTEPWAQAIELLIGRPAHVVPNGFDPDDYPATVRHDTGRFVLAFTGMVYPGRQSARPLFQAIRTLASAGEIEAEWFQVRFTGPGLQPITDEITAEGVQAFASIHPAVSHAESLALQREATALLFLDWLRPEGRGWHSAKIYEYAGAERPVLSVGPPDSAVASLIHRARIGEAAVQPFDIVPVLRRWIGEWRAGGTVRYAPDVAVREEMTRHAAVRALADVFDNAVAAGPGAAKVPTHGHR